MERGVRDDSYFGNPLLAKERLPTGGRSAERGQDGRKALGVRGALVRSKKVR